MLMNVTIILAISMQSVTTQLGIILVNASQDMKGMDLSATTSMNVNKVLMIVMKMLNALI